MCKQNLNLVHLFVQEKILISFSKCKSGFDNDNYTGPLIVDGRP